jgi:hypothetical protein
MGKLLQFGRTYRGAVAGGVAYGKVTALVMADQEWIVEEQTGNQKTHCDLPNCDRTARARGLRDVHLPGLDTSTLNLTAYLGQEDACALVPIREEVGIIARGAMIPVVGSITEVQTLRVSEACFTPE